jgi:hypothetical protein
MAFWNTFWMVVFAAGFVAFLIISTRVITRGFAEMRSLIRQYRSGEE